MEEVLLIPNFITGSEGSKIILPCESVNALFIKEYTDSLGFYQNQYGVFSWMKLDRNRTFVMRDIKGSPLLWQKFNSCSWDPIGRITTGKREVTPQRIKINSESCYDEFFESAFETLLVYDGQGPVELDAAGVQVVNAFIDELLIRAKEGLEILLAVGGLYDPETVTYAAETTEDIIAAFKKTSSSVQGFVPWFREYGAHLDAAVDLTGVGVDIFDIVDGLKAEAKPALQTLINSGGRTLRSGRPFMPILVLSDSLFSSVVNSYSTQSIAAAMNDPRLRREPVTSPIPGAPKFTYWIDLMPIVPLSQINGYDQYLDGTTYFAAIWASGAVQLGGSFDSLPTIDGSQVGLLVERSTRVKDYGTYYFASHALANVGLPDTDYIVAASEIIEAES